MSMKSKNSKSPKKINLPASRIICDSENKVISHCDTLDRIASIMALLQELNLSEGLSPGAETGLYLVQSTLIDSVQYVSDALQNNGN